MPIEVTFDAILSDMDGTLVDSTAAVEATMSAWAIEQGIAPVEFFKHSHGVRTQDNIRRFQTVPKPGTGLTEEEMTATVNRLEFGIAENGRILAENGKGGIFALPGVHKFIADLQRGNARWGIVTSATLTYASSALETGGIKKDAPHLPFLITANDVVRGKPNPDPYLAGLKALGKLGGPEIDPKRVLVLEDAPSGLASGLAAGCVTLAVCTGQTIERIKATPATYRVLDLTKVDVVKASAEGITLRIQTLEEDEKPAANGSAVTA